MLITLRPRNGKKKKMSQEKKVEVETESKLSITVDFEDLKFAKKTLFLPYLAQFITRETNTFYGVNINLDYSDVMTRTAVTPLIGEVEKEEVVELTNKQFVDSFFNFIQERLQKRLGAVVFVKVEERVEPVRLDISRIVKSSEKQGKNSVYKFGMLKLIEELTRVYYSVYLTTDDGRKLMEYVTTCKKIINTQKTFQEKLLSIGIDGLPPNCPNTLGFIDKSIQKVGDKMKMFLEKNGKGHLIENLSFDPMKNPPTFSTSELLGKRKRVETVETCSPTELHLTKKMKNDEHNDEELESEFNFCALEKFSDNKDILGEIGSLIHSCKTKEETVKLFGKIGEKAKEVELEYEILKKKNAVYGVVSTFLTENKMRAVINRFDLQKETEEEKRRKAGFDFLSSFN